MNKPNVAEVCKRFRCTEEQARALYRKNAVQLRDMADACIANEAKGKKTHSGYPATAEQAAIFRAQANAFDAA